MNATIKKILTLKNILSIWVAFVFVQSLFFKFTGSPETTYIFGTLGEWSGLPWFDRFGAYGVGTAELIAALLLFTRWHGIGAVMALGIMSGAIFFHLFTPLGVQMPVYDESGGIIGNDGGLLFGMACLVWLSALVLVIRDTTKAEGFFFHLRKA